MANDDYKATRIGSRALEPQTLMMGYGYAPGLSEGALKPPIFLTSTFVFQSAQQGKDLFDLAAGRRAPRAGEKTGLVYSRFNNPNLEILEDRLALWDGAERGAVFASGMAAISTTLFTFLRPGDALVYSRPIYGGTETLVQKQMAELGIVPVPFANGLDVEAIRAAAAGAGRRVGAMLVETPGNPTNSLVDIGAVRVVADEIGAQQGGAPPVIVDNTFLGPVYQKPLALGADVVVYSLTKYAGGHSDLTAGGACGAAEPMRRIMQTRGALGTQLDPHTCWMLLRSLETLEIRCARAVDNARRVATFLAAHPKIERVHYLGFPGDPAEQAVYARQCTSPGSTFSFEVRGGEPAAFAMLDALRVIKLAVSLGGTETLISHPASTTHSGVAPDQRAASGVTESLVRISIGIESADDLIADLAAALAG